MKCADRDEEQWRAIGLKNLGQSRRSSFNHNLGVEAAVPSRKIFFGSALAAASAPTSLRAKLVRRFCEICAVLTNHSQTSGLTSCLHFSQAFGSREKANSVVAV